MVPRSKAQEIKATPIWGYIVCIGGFSLAVAAFYPGYMSPDSIATWLQGRSLDFRDSSSPVMALLWSLIGRAIPGPAGMLILQNLVLWGAVAFFWLTTHRKSPWLGIGLVVFPFMPGVLALTGTIWKDVGMAACLLLSVALFYRSIQTKAKVPLVLTFPLLFYAYAVRLNAAPAVLPLAIWTGYIACRVFPSLRLRAGKFKALPLIVGAGYFVVLSVGTVAINHLLTKGRTEYPFQIVQLYDLAAISKERGVSMFPGYIEREPNFSMENLSSQYNPYSAADMVWADKPSDKPALKLSYDPADISELRMKWLTAISQNKRAYLKHRLKVFLLLIRLPDGDANPYWRKGFTANPVEYRPTPGPLNRFLMSYFYLLRNSLFFSGALWLVICVALIYFALRRRLRDDWEVVFVLATSGLIYALPYFFITASAEFRYLYWTVIASAVALLFGLNAALGSRNKVAQVKTPISLAAESR